MTNPLYDQLFGAQSGSDAAFLILPDGRKISYARFASRTAQLANTLQDQGLEPGDRLAVQIPKCPDALAIYAACARAGIIFLPLNTGYTAPEVSYFVKDSGAKLLLADPKRTAELSTEISAPVMGLGPDETGSFAEAAAQKSPEFQTVTRRADDLAAFLYTSGTTGRSKGAMLTQSNLLSNARTLKDLWGFTAADRLLHALPVFHTHGLFVATNITALAGGAMIFLPGFDAGEMIRLMPQATSMMGVPTFYTRLLSDPRLNRQATENMRLFISGSAPLLAETHTEFEARTGHAILERYGMTETNMNSSNPLSGPRIAGTVGRPLPDVELKITDPATGAPLPQGEIGQIEVRGPNVFKGYWNMPEKTAEELRTNGFFITGDLGQIGPDGYLRIVGRGKDLIISGGYNIYPKEVEDVLDAQDGVIESAVIGVPHPDFGEAVLAVLACKPGAHPDLEALKAAAGAKLARFKLPKAYKITDALPRNTMGKVQKNILRTEFAQEFS